MAIIKNRDLRRLAQLAFFITSISVLAAFAGVNVSSPVNGSSSGSPIHVVAGATSSYPITAMRIYLDDNSVYTVSANNLDTYVTATSGTHNLVVQAWDSTGAVFKNSSTVAVGAPAAGVTVTSPANGTTMSSPVNVAATASSGSVYPITAMRVYVDNNTAYTVNANQLNTSLTLAAGSHYVVVQAWDSAGNVFRTDRSINVNTASAPPQPQPPTPTTGHDWYVYSSGKDASTCGTAGNPCATINYVNGKVAPGDTVHVSGSFTLNSGTCIKTTTSGAAGKPITYKADPSARINGNAACFYMWYNTAAYINIYGFDFTGVQTNSNTDSGTSVILSEGSGGNVDVAYNTIHDLPSGFSAAIDMAPYGSGGYTGAPCSVHDNVFHDLGYNSGLQHGNYAVYISCGTNSKVYNNLIYNEGSIGIHCWHAANQVHIYNNTIANAQFIGIIVGTGDSGALANAYFDVSNNIIVNSKYGVIAEASSPGSVSKSSLFRNNLVFNNQVDWSYNGGSSGSMQSAGYAVTGTVTGDPKFVSPSTGNYRLSSNSPAIGKGLNVGITGDLDGNPRPSATGINIGAY